MAEEVMDESLNLAEAAEALKDLPPLEEADTDNGQAEPEDGEGDEPELDEEDAGTEKEEEPVKPGISPPHSLNAEDRAKFAQLPPEAQRMLADIEVRRARQANEAFTDAATAQRKAAGDAVQAKQQFAQQLHTFAAAYAPQRPNPANYADMQQFAHDNARYEYAAQEHQDLMKRVLSIGEEAQGEADRFNAERAQFEERKLRGSLPDWFDPEKGPKMREDLTAIGSELGYSPELMAQADAGDLMALWKAHGWKRDAEKYRAIMDRQMKGVRAAKTASPGTQQPQSATRKVATKEATSRLAKSGSLEDAAAALNGILR